MSDYEGLSIGDGPSMMRRCFPVSCLAAGLSLVSLARADTPADRYAVDIASDTVTDRHTGLVWQRTVDAGTYTWDAAKAYCSGLGVGWRLPAFKELLTLVDPARSNPCIDPVFPNTPTTRLWTASPDVGSSGKAWGVAFYWGDSTTKETTYNYRVRCVR